MADIEYPIEGSERQPRILAVDDDPINIELLKRMLGELYDLSTARSGREALSLLEQQSFDVMLLDIMMPGMSGLEVLEKVREKYPQTDLPVILVSALADTRDVVRGLKLGANDYITKPVDVNLARARVDTHLQIKWLSDERRSTIAELRELQKMHERFFRIASHDLKNPLNNIQMAYSLLRDMFPDREEVLNILNIMHTSLGNMWEVVEDFLDTIILRTNPENLLFECVSLSKLMFEVMMQYSISASNKNIKLEFGNTEGHTWGDPRRLRQIFTNLVSNAIKYSERGGEVLIWSETRADVVRIHIADRGPGIRPEERDKLFTEFGKLSNRPTAGEVSTGLGLWIVKHLSTLHNGTVGVDDREGGGSVFWVELPSCVPDPEQEQTEDTL